MRLRWKCLALTVLVTGAGLAACSPSSSTSTFSSGSTHASTTTIPFTSTLPPTTTTAVPPSTTTTAPADAHLTISSTDVSVGEVVDVTGTGCPAGYLGEPDLYAVGPNAPAILHQAGYTDIGMFFLATNGNSRATVGHDGLWTMMGVVPMVPPGTAMLGGICSPTEDGDVGSPQFYYPTLSVDVTSRYRLVVEPSTTVEAGTRLTVTSVGGNCQHSFATPETSLYSVSDMDLADGTIPVVRSSMPWKSLLTVPRGLAPGRYRPEADCVVSRGAVYDSYVPVIITVR